MVLALWRCRLALISPLDTHRNLECIARRSVGGANNLVALDQGHGSKYTRIAIELQLVIHSHNRGHDISRDKHTLAHRRQMEEFAIIEGQLGIAEVVWCRRASNRDFVDVLRTWSSR